MMKFILVLLLILGTDDSYAAEKPVPVRIAEVKRAPLQQELPLTGLIAAQRISDLSSRVDALVLEVRVKAGDSVNEDDVLIRLDDVMAGYEVERSAAALEEANARLQESVRRRDELAKLVKNQYQARSSYDTARSEVRINKAIVKRLQTEYRKNRETVSQHLIKAPFSGVISHKSIEVGEWIKVGDTVLELVDIEHLRVEARVPQRYFSQLAVGSVVLIQPDTLHGTSIKAKITRKVPVASRSAHSFPVHIEVDNHSGRLMPGMTAKVTLMLQTGNNGRPVLWLPRDAVIKNTAKEEVVWTIRKEKKQWHAYPVTVTTGKISKGKVEMVEGQLQVGDKIVIRGNERLKPGQQIRIIP